MKFMSQDCWNSGGVWGRAERLSRGIVRVLVRCGMDGRVRPRRAQRRGNSEIDQTWKERDVSQAQPV